jgi:hypothetical protein
MLANTDLFFSLHYGPVLTLCCLFSKIFKEWQDRPDQALLSSNAIDAGFKIRPTEEELKEMVSSPSPLSRERWLSVDQAAYGFI